jgi:anti-sigma regulatory factor (Ser/Thr protein kinase)
MVMQGDRALPCEARSAGIARRFVLDMLSRWGHFPNAETAALLVSELVTNAVLHARTPLHLSLRTTGGRIRVEVSDGDRERPTLRDPEPVSPGGRGLVLVDRLASAWGVEERPTGKVVWFELSGSS